MASPDREAIIAKFPPDFRKLYEKFLEGMRKPAPIAQAPRPMTLLRRPNKPAYVAPLVDKVKPNTVRGARLAPVTSEETVQRDNFIREARLRADNQAKKGEIMSDQFVVDGWQTFHNLVRDNVTLRQEAEVEAFVKLADSIPNSCGCVRGQLSGSASNMYAQMLPILQARNSEFFELIKTEQTVTRLVFKEGDLLLLEV